MVEDRSWEESERRGARERERERLERDRERQERERSRLNVITLFDRLGYDLTEPSEVQRLNENLRFAEKERRQRERIDTNKLTMVFSALVAIFGAAATIFVQWAYIKLGGTSK